VLLPGAQQADQVSDVTAVVEDRQTKKRRVDDVDDQTAPAAVASGVDVMQAQPLGGLAHLQPILFQPTAEMLQMTEQGLAAAVMYPLPTMPVMMMPNTGLAQDNSQQQAQLVVLQPQAPASANTQMTAQGSALEGSGPETEVEMKKMRRLVKNRESARNSRCRKKQYMEELESKIEVLQSEKQVLETEVIQLRAANAKLSSRGCKHCICDPPGNPGDQTINHVVQIKTEDAAVPDVPGQDLVHSVVSSISPTTAVSQNAGKAVMLMAMVVMVGLVVHSPGINSPALGMTKSAFSPTLYRPPLSPHSGGRVLLSVGDSDPKSIEPPLDKKQVFLVVLLEHFCRTLEVHGESSLFNMLCQKLYSLGILDSISFLEDMDGLRLQYEKEFGKTSEFGTSHVSGHDVVKSVDRLATHKLLDGTVARSDARDALTLPGFFKKHDFKVEVDNFGVQPQLIACPEARLLPSPAVKRPASKSADGNAKALISLILPEASVAGILHPASQLNSDSDDMYEVQCRVDTITKLPHGQEHFKNVHVAMTALDQLVGSTSTASS
jgi:hypothetical protein